MISLAFPHGPSDEHSDNDPSHAEDFGIHAQIPPDESANGGTDRGDEKRECNFFFGAELVVHQGGDVYADKGDEGSKVEQFRALLIRQQESAAQGNRANDQDVVSRDLMTWIDSAEDFGGEGVASSHAVHQAGCAELGGDTGSHIGDEESGVEEFKQERSADTRSNEYEGSIHHIGWKRLASGPCQLGHIDFSHGKHADDEASENGGDKDVSARVLNFFRHGRDAIESDVGEDGDRGAMKEGGRNKSGGVVEGVEQVSAGRVNDSQDVSNSLTKKEHHDQAHDDGEDCVDAAGGLNAPGVEERGEEGEGNDPEQVGDSGLKIAGGLAAPDDADDGIEDVVHEHGPSDDVA